MALPAAIGCGALAGLSVPLIAQAADPSGGFLRGQVVRLPVSAGVAFGWSWAAFAGVTLIVWALLGAVRNR